MLFWKYKHEKNAFEYFHESKLSFIVDFVIKLGIHPYFKDIPPIILAYQYSDMLILMEQA